MARRLIRYSGRLRLPTRPVARAGAATAAIHRRLIGFAPQGPGDDLRVASTYYYPATVASDGPVWFLHAFLKFLSHRMFRHMHGVLNID